MAKRKGRKRAGRDARAERCIFCRIGEKLAGDRKMHAGVVEHLAGAKRELLEAVREFVDNELDALEAALRRRKGKRVTKIDVEE